MSTLLFLVWDQEAIQHNNYYSLCPRFTRVKMEYDWLKEELWMFKIGARPTDWNK